MLLFPICMGICTHLSEVEDVSVVNRMQGIDSSSEGVDLLVRISNQDFPTALSQQHIHDCCDGRQEDTIKNLKFSEMKKHLGLNKNHCFSTGSTVLSLINEKRIIAVRQAWLWVLELP